jgi:hypothetical protein
VDDLSIASGPALRVTDLSARAAIITSSAYPMTGMKVGHQVDGRGQVGEEETEADSDPARKCRVGSQTLHGPHEVGDQTQRIPKWGAIALASGREAESGNHSDPEQNEPGGDGDQGLPPVVHLRFRLLHRVGR